MHKSRRGEIIIACTDLLAKKGLYTTSSRDLSAEIDLNPAGMYYYFNSKDELIVACAELAAKTVGDKAVLPAIDEMFSENPDIDKILKCARNMSPYMIFLIQAYTEATYHDRLIATVSTAGNRYILYAQTLALKMNVDISDAIPYIYMGVSAVTNYMIFGDTEYATKQLNITIDSIQAALK